MTCDRAIAADPALQEAWACRGEAFSEAGDAREAIASLDRALEIGESAPLLSNRAAARQAAGLWGEALADLGRAGRLDPADEEITEAISRCRHRLVR